MKVLTACLLVLLLCNLAVGQKDELSEMQISPDKDRTISVGDDQILTCTYTEEVLRDVVWLGPDGKAIVNDPPKKTLESSEGRLILTLEDLSTEETGIYRCEGVSIANNSTVGESRELRIIEEVEIVDTPSVQNFKIGETVSVECNVKGPEPEVFWIFGNDKYTIKKGSSNLIITNITMEDSGNYTCNARNLNIGQLKKQPIQVNVMVPPEIQNFEKQFIATAGEKAELSCKATGDPDPSYRWYKGDGTVLDETMLISDNSTVELDVTKDFTGLTYTCVAENAIASDKQTLEMTVYVKPSFTVLKSATTQEGEEVVLRCVAEGVPPPIVFIYQDDIMLDETAPIPDIEDLDINVTDQNSTYWATNRHVIYNGNEAVINFTYVEYKDEGKYECRADNDAGTEIATVNMNVLYAPKKTELKDVWVCDESPASLKCIFKANPAPILSWGRYQPVEGSNELDSSSFVVFNTSDLPDGVSIITVGDILTLVVDPNVKDRWGTYYCLAENEIGTNNATAEIIKAGPPEAPFDVQITDIETTSATVSFEFLPSVPEIEYFIITLAPASSDKNTLKEHIYKDLYEHTFKDLDHGMTYTVIVEAKNCADTGPPSESQEFTTKTIENPDPVEIISGEMSKDHDKYTVEWENKGLGGGEISKIMIVLNQVIEEIDGDNQTLKKLNEFMLNPTDAEFENRSLTIEELDPSSRYEISVDIYNEVGVANSKKSFMTALRPESTTQSSFIPKVFNTGSVDLALIGIIIGVLLLLVIIIDLICFFARSWGITFWIYSHTCGKNKQKHDVRNAEEGSAEFRKDSEAVANASNEVEEEKQPFANEAEPLANGETTGAKLSTIDEQTPLQAEEAAVASGNGNAPPEAAKEPTPNGADENTEKNDQTAPEEENLVQKTEENA